MDLCMNYWFKPHRHYKSICQCNK